MKDFFFKNIYTKGISAGILLIVSPVVFWLLLFIPSLIYPNDCDISAVCEHTIVQIALSLSFALIFFFGLPLLLLGTAIVLFFTFLYGIHSFRRCDTSGQRFKILKISLGALSGLVFLYALYIPSGPDECSRTITAGQYTNCLEEQLYGKSEAETRLWLQERGYKTYETYELNGLSTDNVKDYSNLNVDSYFEASRTYGRPNSLPYGTNFTRYLLPYFPAPARFTIKIGIQDSPEGIYYIHPDWSFSFL